MLGECTAPLVGHYDLVMLDLDGVVYVGPEAVPGAAEHLAAVREAGAALAFITNNAARTPDRVAGHLTELGIAATPADVVTSAQAAASMLLATHGRGARVVCLGGPGLHTALAEAGLVPVGPEDDAVAAVTGYGPDVLWGDIMRVAVRIRDGLPWVASNTDGTIPTQFGVAPGHGVLVGTISRFSGVTPSVAGKPERPLLDETVRRVGGDRPLMVGDRLDTDIEGARRAGTDSLLVLTGVTGLPELVAARPAERPTYVARDLGGLFTTHPAPAAAGDRWELGGWTAEVADGRLVVTGVGAPDDWWRAAAAASWAHLDATGDTAGVADVAVPGPGTPGR